MGKSLPVLCRILILGIIVVEAFHDHNLHVDYEYIEEEASRLAWLSKEGLNNVVKEHA
jgi:hypothetical protein